MTKILILCLLCYGILFSAVHGSKTEEPCEDDTVHRSDVHFVNVTSDFDFKIWRTTYPYSYSLKIIYKWDLQLPENLTFDGILYKHVDREEEESKLLEHSQNFGYGGSFGFFGFGSPMMPIQKKCDGSSGKTLWAVDNNDSSVECKIPCSQYFPPPCQSNEICSRIIEDDFIALPKSNHHLEVEAKFGRSYDMKLLLYRHWNVLKQYEFPHNKIIRFCREELVMKQQIDPSFAEEFCSKEQEMEDSHVSAGPISYFDLYSVKQDLETNRGTVVFRWKSPLDISSHVNITGFSINTHEGIGDDVVIDSTEHDNYLYYYTSVSNIVFGKKHIITVTPLLSFDKTVCTDRCSSHGFSLSEEYTIPDVNACVEPTRYCDIQADCQDLPSQNKTSAICSCPEGFYGNGINKSFTGGTGCRNFNYCNVNFESYPCHPNAICMDSLLSSSNITCSCPNYYIGNGYKDGSGCMRLSTVVFLSVGIPCIILFSILLTILMRRIKITRNRIVKRKFSRFVVNSGTKYSSPDWSIKYNNNTKPCGMFGEKYEIDKNDVQLTELIGRGNFGIVHKGIYKTENNKPMTVAVKTTAEPHTEEMEREFQAEIYLITSLGKHENVMGMIGCCTMGPPPIFLVTKFMKYGDLKHFLWDAREERKRMQDPIYILTEKDIYMISEQVACGMEYLTGLRFIHGDIAARNILVDEGLQCKISDFGLTNDVYRYGVIKGAREKKVPLRWISPERMLNGTVPITWRSDVWSFGILLYEAITLGSTPYPGIESEDLLNKVKSGYRMSRPPTCGQHLYSVMLKCWEWIPSNRPSFKQLKEVLKVPGIRSGEHYVNISAIEEA